MRFSGLAESLPDDVDPPLASDFAGAPARAERGAVVLLLGLFFGVGYLWAGSGHSAADVWFGGIWLDALIPLVPPFIVFYMLGYVFVLSPVFVLRRRQEFEAGVVVFAGMLGLAFLVFHFFPVFMHKPLAMGDDFLSTLTRYQQRTDVVVNNLPSLHVALNVFAWLVLFCRARRTALWLLPVVLCIVASTLLVKQHLVLDVLGGAVWAGAGFLAWRRLRHHSGTRMLYASTLVLLVILLVARLAGLPDGPRELLRSLATVTAA
ncbi:phosphatase PAP2 family protein [Halofilum ochraceum]|uniref:phosphatase PAP2 family protein n=1 Tax=Halofilum ochraceum TaxID=1611323 RepID=UPI000836D2F0|nr:phosphatase PAP2 family protein [Halofilum ochraceum]